MDPRSGCKAKFFRVVEFNPRSHPFKPPHPNSNPPGWQGYSMLCPLTYLRAASPRIVLASTTSEFPSVFTHATTHLVPP